MKKHLIQKLWEILYGAFIIWIGIIFMPFVNETSAIIIGTIMFLVLATFMKQLTH